MHGLFIGCSHITMTFATRFGYVSLVYRAFRLVGRQEAVTAMAVNTCRSLLVSLYHQRPAMYGILVGLDDRHLRKILHLVGQLLVLVAGNTDFHRVLVIGAGVRVGNR